MVVVIPNELNNFDYYDWLISELELGEGLEFIRQRDLHHFLIYAEKSYPSPIVMKNHYHLKLENKQLITY